jgi:Tol biopolymer transport system component
VTVTAPPRHPAPPAPKTPDELEALIEEARRRARRRRLRNAAAAVAVGATILGALGAWRLGGNGSPPHAAAAAPRPLPMPAPFHRGPLPANGVVAVVQGNAIVAKAADGSRTRLLATCPGTYGDCNFGTFDWSPDGRFLVFLAGHFGGAVTVNNLGLYVVHADGVGPRELARCGDCNQFQGLSWSPDSRLVVFAADNGVYVVDVASGTLRLVGTASTLLGPTTAWSPGGSRIAVASGSDLYTMRPNGSGFARVARVSPAVAHPAWSPDGTRIVFDAGDNVYVVDADGTHLKRLLSGALGAGPGVPSWSPNGRRILYFNTPGAPQHFTGQVWSMRPDGSDRRRLYDAGCCVGEWQPPIWSPDGRRVALSGATESDGVVVMDADGRHRRQLLDLASALAWQPLPRASAAD